MLEPTLQHNPSHLVTWSRGEKGKSTIAHRRKNKNAKKTKTHPCGASPKSCREKASCRRSLAAQHFSSDTKKRCSRRPNLRHQNEGAPIARQGGTPTNVGVICYSALVWRSESWCDNPSMSCRARPHTDSHQGSHEAFANTRAFSSRPVRSQLKQLLRRTCSMTSSSSHTWGVSRTPLPQNLRYKIVPRQLAQATQPKTGPRSAPKPGHGPTMETS